MGRPFPIAATMWLAAAGCNPTPPSSHRDPPLVEAALLGGDDADTAFPRVAFVVAELPDGAFDTCVGTLVAPNLLAVARSCITGVSPGPFLCTLDGSVTEGDGGRYGPDRLDYGGVQVFVDQLPTGPQSQPDARGFELIDDGGDHLCGHDLAFLVLDRALVGFEPMPLQLNRLVEMDERLDVVGWGATSEGEEYVVKRNVRRSVPITQVNPVEPVEGASDIFVSPRTLHTELVLCEGDTGAPAFSAAGALVGVGSGNYQEHGSGGLCGVGFSVFSVLAAFPAVVEEAFEAADQRIWREGEPPPASVDVDDACIRDDNCASGVCLARDADGGFCVEACGADADCPEGKLCQLTDDGGYCSATAAKTGCQLGGSKAPSSWWGLLVAAAIARRLSASCGGEGCRSARDG